MLFMNKLEFSALIDVLYRCDDTPLVLCILFIFKKFTKKNPGTGNSWEGPAGPGRRKREHPSTGVEGRPSSRYH
jgi:hypothetical protein